MSIPKPYRTAFQKDGSIRYDFKPEFSKNGKYYPRGSICWPILNEQTQVSEGFIICAAQHIDSKTVIIFESGPFRCIDHILYDEGKIECQGISSLLNSVWSCYNCNLFYHSDSLATHNLYANQLFRSTMIKPMPGFPEVPIKDWEDAKNILFAWKTKRMIVMDEDSRLHSELLMWENTGTKLEMASVRALITLINGYERYRFMPRNED